MLATIATDRTRGALADGRPVLSQATALNDGYSRAFEVAAALTLAAFAASFGVVGVVRSAHHKGVQRPELRLGLAHDALVGVKHSSTLARSAH